MRILGDIVACARGPIGAGGILPTDHRKMQPYTDDYHHQLHPGSVRSAREVVPLVLRMLGSRSVIDVGCGRGAWLTVFRELGVTDICGVDGEYVSRDKLAFPSDY